MFAGDQALAGRLVAVMESARRFEQPYSAATRQAPRGVVFSLLCLCLWWVLEWIRTDLVASSWRG